MLLLFILVCLSSDIKTKKAKLFYEKKAKSLLEEKYDSISKVYSNNAKLYHDISNHLNILYQLLNDGLYVEAQAYIEKISEPTKLLTKRKWTGNQMIDAILNCKIEQMDELNIGYKVVSDFPIVARIENSDICIVLSNLLDNAVEAVSEMQNPDKIKIIIRTIKQFLYIQIENKCDCANKEIDGLPLSTKLDCENHGWGLQSVATIVEKYNGTYHYSVEDGVFIATVILFTEYKCT